MPVNALWLIEPGFAVLWPAMSTGDTNPGSTMLMVNGSRFSYSI